MLKKLDTKKLNRQQARRAGLFGFLRAHREVSEIEARIKASKSVTDEPVVHETKTPWRGWDAKGGGYGTLPNLTVYRGTTRQVCGLYPFVNGSQSPLMGAPLGVHDDTGEDFGFDIFTWFDRGRIGRPSMFILGNPAIGKSTLIRRMIMGVLAMNIKVFILGDPKNEYTGLIELIGGQVIRLGPGGECVNILDAGEAREAAKRILAECKDTEKAERIVKKLLKDRHRRRQQMVMALTEIYRDAKASGTEGTIISLALTHLDNNHDGTPILADLRDVIQEGPADVRRVAPDPEEYRAETKSLINTLNAICADPDFGPMFNGPTTKPVNRHTSVSFDLEGIDVNDTMMLGAAYLAAWAAGFGVIYTAHALADAGLEQHQRFLAVMDEFWQALAAGPGMIDRVDALTRLDRSMGAAAIYATHTLSDLNAIRDPESREKAKGFATRTGMRVMGGLDREEFDDPRLAQKMTKAEIDRIVSWNSPAPVSKDGKRQPMPGRGKFVAKVGEEVGIPFRVEIPEIEERYAIHDTNVRIKNYQEEEVAA